MSKPAEEKDDPKTSTDALLLWAKIQFNLHEMDKKRVELLSRRKALEAKFPFLEDIPLEEFKAEEGEEEPEKPMGAEASEDPELVKQRHKLRNKKLKEKRKKKKAEKGKAQETEEQLAQAEENLGMIDFESHPPSPAPTLAAAAVALFSSAGETTHSPEKSKRARVSHLKILGKAKDSKTAKEGGLAPPERAQLQHVDETHRSDNTGNPEVIQEQ